MFCVVVVSIFSTTDYCIIFSRVDYTFLFAMLYEQCGYRVCQQEIVTGANSNEFILAQRP
jgi:hypothetical protein